MASSILRWLIYRWIQWLPAPPPPRPPTESPAEGLRYANIKITELQREKATLINLIELLGYKVQGDGEEGGEGRESIVSRLETMVVADVMSAEASWKAECEEKKKKLAAEQARSASPRPKALLRPEEKTEKLAEISFAESELCRHWISPESALKPFCRPQNLKF